MSRYLINILLFRGDRCHIHCLLARLNNKTIQPSKRIQRSRKCWHVKLIVTLSYHWTLTEFLFLLLIRAILLNDELIVPVILNALVDVNVAHWEILLIWTIQVVYFRTNWNLMGVVFLFYVYEFLYDFLVFLNVIMNADYIFVGSSH